VRKAEGVIDVVLFAPSHQLSVAEAEVSAQHDLHLWPASAQLLEDAADSSTKPAAASWLAGCNLSFTVFLSIGWYLRSSAGSWI
jgi:hypothetical protein